MKDTVRGRAGWGRGGEITKSKDSLARLPQAHFQT